MNRVLKIAKNEKVRPILDGFEAQVEDVVELAIAIQQIPAPTFAEQERATFIESEFKELGLVNVNQDDLANVYGRLPGTKSAQASPIIVSAHSDTVFPAETDLTVRRDGRIVHGPGIGDNSTGVAGIIALAKAIQIHQLQIPADIWFVSNVGEEGLGDLRGMRAVVERFGRHAIYLVVEGGLFGQISHQGIGVQRFLIEVETPGGHSWGNFGRRSAIHELGRVIVALDDLPVPSAPKTTFNVGVIEGGTSINTIAQTASLQLDLRSEDPQILADLVNRVSNIVAHADAQQDITVTMKMIGNRPAGKIHRDSLLVNWARTALKMVGRNHPHFIASSTDANVPLSLGYDAVCVGLTESSNAHRLDEYMDSTHLPNGLGQLLLLTLAAAGFKS